MGASGRVAVALVLTALVGACDDRPPANETDAAVVRTVERAPPPATVTEQPRFTAAFRAVGGHLASARDRALEALDREGENANAEAVAALASSNGAVRRGAATHLSRSGNAAAADAIIAALATGDGGDAFRMELIAALGHVATPACVAQLAMLVEGPCDREAFAAGRELGACGAELPRDQLAALTGMGNDAHVRGAALLALGPTIRAEEADLFRAGAMDFAPPIRACAVAGIARLPDLSREEMAALVEDEDGGVRHAALSALLSCEADWVAAVAQSALDDKYDENRVAACEAIAARPDEHSYEVLLAVLTNEKQDSHVRGAAARGILRIDPARGVGAVEAVAAEDSGGARLYCRDALEQLPHDEP